MENTALTIAIIHGNGKLYRSQKDVFHTRGNDRVHLLPMQDVTAFMDAFNLKEEDIIVVN